MLPLASTLSPLRTRERHRCSLLEPEQKRSMRVLHTSVVPGASMLWTPQGSYSTRLAEKEQPNYEDPATKASRVQQAKIDFTGASRRLRRAISKTLLISNPLIPNADSEALAEVAAACGASEEDVAALREEQVVASVAE